MISYNYTVSSFKVENLLLKETFLNVIIQVKIDRLRG